MILALRKHPGASSFSALFALVHGTAYLTYPARTLRAQWAELLSVKSLRIVEWPVAENVNDAQEIRQKVSPLAGAAL